MIREGLRIYTLYCDVNNLYIFPLDNWKKYGNVVSHVCMGRWSVQLFGYEAIHEALVQNSDYFSDRSNVGMNFIYDGIKQG